MGAPETSSDCETCTPYECRRNTLVTSLACASDCFDAVFASGSLSDREVWRMANAPGGPRSCKKAPRAGSQPRTPGLSPCQAALTASIASGAVPGRGCRPRRRPAARGLGARPPRDGRSRPRRLVASLRAALVDGVYTYICHDHLHAALACRRAARARPVMHARCEHRARRARPILPTSPQRAVCVTCRGPTVLARREVLGAPLAIRAMPIGRGTRVGSGRQWTRFRGGALNSTQFAGLLGLNDVEKSSVSEARA